MQYACRWLLAGQCLQPSSRDDGASAPSPLLRLRLSLRKADSGPRAGRPGWSAPGARNGAARSAASALGAGCVPLTDLEVPYGALGIGIGGGRGGGQGLIMDRRCYGGTMPCHASILCWSGVSTRPLNLYLSLIFFHSLPSGPVPPPSSCPQPWAIRHLNSAIHRRASDDSEPPSQRGRGAAAGPVGRVVTRTRSGALSCSGASTKHCAALYSGHPAVKARCHTRTAYTSAVNTKLQLSRITHRPACPPAPPTLARTRPQHLRATSESA